MARFDIREASIYPYYEQLICFNKSARAKAENAEFNAALNMNIILCSACLVEGVLEDRGKLLLGYYREVFNQIDVPDFELRKPMNHFYNSIEEMMHKKVSQSMGLDNFATIFEMLTSKSLKQDEQISVVYEGVSTLFQLRNVIAHGRLIHAYTVDAYYTNGIEENFFGGYKKAENYLTKKGLLSEGFMDVERSDLYFTNDIADHFSNIAHDFLQALDTYISDALLIKEKIQDRVKEFNEKRGTAYSVIEYLRQQGVKP